jgi:Fic family protein
MPSQPSIFRNISSMEPLLPTSGRAELADLSVRIFQKSGELKASLPSKVVRQEASRLIREMNSYYSNLIEGHKTLPRDIEKALRQDFSNQDDERRNQHLSVAHINAEMAMRDRLELQPGTDVFSSEFICWLHAEFYSCIPKEDWFTVSGEGKRFPLEPGKLRDHNVDVGQHTPPDHTALGKFIQRYQSFYADPKLPATDRLVAFAAAHHRLAWIHPFGDGNGRVARLQSQAAMIAAGLDGEGLWTLSRGLARSRPTYYKHLQEADQPRHNDYDGRGNLSDKALSSFCVFFLTQILDQITFMLNLIEPFKLQERIESHLRFVRLDIDPKMRNYLTKLLRELVIQGEINRGAVPQIVGLKGTAGREVIRKALDERLITTSSEKGPLKIHFPSEVLESYFPLLFTDLPSDSR